jgi:hypothetical protein
MKSRRTLSLLGAVVLACCLSRSPAIAAPETTVESWYSGIPAPEPILPRRPLSLSWNPPDGAFWLAGESPEPARDASGNIVSASAWGTAGSRQQVFRHGGISLTMVPLIRAEAGWHADAEAQPKVGAAILQELAVPLSAGLRFNAKTGFGDPIGLSAPNPAGVSGLAFRGEAGLSGSLRPLGDAQTRFDLHLVSTRLLSRGIDETAPSSSCELTLQLTRLAMAPLHIGATCPRLDGERRITFNIGGRF